MSRLDKLYPYEMIPQQQCELDEIKFDVEDVLKSDKSADIVIDLLKQVVPQIRYFNRRDTSSAPKFIDDRLFNLSTLMMALFDLGDGGIFKYLLFDYIGKLTILFDHPRPHTWEAGVLFNTIYELR